MNPKTALGEANETLPSYLRSKVFDAGGRKAWRGRKVFWSALNSVWCMRKAFKSISHELLRADLFASNTEFNTLLSNTLACENMLKSTVDKLHLNYTGKSVGLQSNAIRCLVL
jgi:hypothetical protein